MSSAPSLSPPKGNAGLGTVTQGVAQFRAGQNDHPAPKANRSIFQMFAEDSSEFAQKSKVQMAPKLDA